MILLVSNQEMEFPSGEAAWGSKRSYLVQVPQVFFAQNTETKTAIQIGNVT